MRQPRVLVVDEGGFDVIRNLLDDQRFEIILLPVRERRLGSTLALACGCAKGLSRGLSRMSAYIYAGVKHYRPDLVMTFIDNSPAFHDAARHFHDLPFLAIQNGRRWPFENLGISNGARLSSHYWVIGEVDRANLNYRDIRFRDLKVSGSLHSFLAGSAGSQKTWDILVVSTWQRANGVFSTEFGIILKWLKAYCQLHPEVRVAIASRSPAGSTDASQELDFARPFLDPSWQWLLRESSEDSYKWCDAANIVLSAGSTLSIENVGRGGSALIVHPIQRFKQAYPKLSFEHFPDDDRAFFSLLAPALAGSVQENTWSFDQAACAPVNEFCWSSEVDHLLGK